eukprot:TRINITY_DN5078_c0_g2_i1.p1 TRINITY_DN5078_c0_g2~~TRINITY_DN5078_c0_g2_i1.p1  ORF type:complete len:358 (+),score=32.94 TRINITY_DN5078_c0_g2_i1:526-1599(+)
MDYAWIGPLVVGAALWAASDTIADIVIKENHEIPHRPGSPPSERRHHEIEEKDLEEAMKPKKGEGKLNGDQDAAVSGLVMLIVGVVWHYTGMQGSIVWNPVLPACWLALIAGSFQCVALLCLLKAFETAPSTVVVPLMQLSAVFVLPISVLVTLLSYRFDILASHHTAIHPLHLIAFVLIFVGGFYPSAEGNIKRFLSSAFWRQPAVVYMLFSDILMALYYVLVSICTNASGGMSSSSFMIVSIYGNAITFLSLYIFVVQFRASIHAMSKLAPKYLALSALGEVLSLLGYFVISFSYHWYYNSGIVSAAEGALNQLFNLCLAFIAKKFLSLGRPVENIREKLLSSLLVSVGLLMTSV